MEFNKCLTGLGVDSSAINFIWDYHPKNRGEQDSISEDMLTLKNLHNLTPFNSDVKEKVSLFCGCFCKYFAYHLPLYTKHYTFCCVPSHLSETDNKNGIYMFSRWCKPIRDHFDKDLLVRTHDIESLHSGGDRDKSVHLSSLKVNKSVSGKRVVVMDDITTTGHTLEACKSLLMKAGAKEVYLFSFAKTKSKNRQWF